MKLLLLFAACIGSTGADQYGLYHRSYVDLRGCTSLEVTGPLKSLRVHDGLFHVDVPNAGLREVTFECLK